MEKIFVGLTVEECLSAAIKELHISDEAIKYTILEEKKGIFKKHAKISVELPTINVENENNGVIKISRGVITVTNAKNDGQPPVISPVISPSKGVKLIIDGVEVKSKREVHESSIIEYILEESSAKRNMNISVSEDKTEAYISITYTPKFIYEIKDKEDSREVILESFIKEKIFPEFYSINEIKQQLSDQGIIYGIVPEALEKCSDKNGVISLLIAKGTKTVNEENEILEIKFSVDKNLYEDGKGNIDFKSIGSVEAVEKGDILAVRHKGENGKDGICITGEISKFRVSNKIKIKIGSGCSLKDDDTIIANIKGKPCFKNNMFYVFPVHEMNGDVDIKSGNITFPGDIVIHGNVNDGMTVEAGNSLKISGNVERSSIVSKGYMRIKGNVISSNLTVGGKDILKLKQIKNITSMLDIIAALMGNIEEVKKYNLLGYSTTDGQIIKVLIETKYKLLPSLCLSIITNIALDKSASSDDLKLQEGNKKIVELIKSKLIGLGPISIKNYGELDEIMELLSNKKEFIIKLLQIPANAKLSYIQDSNINCSGDIVITGKGSLVSNIKANNKIVLSGINSIIRGGTAYAKDEIRCKNVGGEGGILTKLQVGIRGHIYADTAYENTQFNVGDIEYNLEKRSKEVHVYLNNNNELVVDKFKL